MNEHPSLSRRLSVLSEIERIEFSGNSAVLHSKNHNISIQPPLYSRAAFYWKAVV